MECSFVCYHRVEVTATSPDGNYCDLQKLLDVLDGVRYYASMSVQETYGRRDRLTKVEYSFVMGLLPPERWTANPFVTKFVKKFVERQLFKANCNLKFKVKIIPVPIRVKEEWDGKDGQELRDRFSRLRKMAGG